MGFASLLVTVSTGTVVTKGHMYTVQPLAVQQALPPAVAHAAGGAGRTGVFGAQSVVNVGPGSPVARSRSMANT